MLMIYILYTVPDLKAYKGHYLVDFPLSFSMCVVYSPINFYFPFQK